jgi:hydroxyacylglutathione hydrolase
MILRQYYLGCLAHASYLIADEPSGQAVVVDPQRDVDGYVADAESLGCRIAYVFLTHFHADFVAGHLELRDRVGATICLGARAQAEYAFTALGDGDSVTLGAVRLEVLETPGHSPESISISVYDRDADTAPYAVLTGDTLFIGDVGRPDLRATLGWSAEDLGSLLYDSLRQKLLTLPDETLVYPTHGAGSLCGKNLSTHTVSTIGVQRLYNYALQPMSREQFIAIITADQPDTPAYFSYDAVLNAKERQTLDQALAQGQRELPLEEVLALQRAGAQVLDTRDGADYEGAHLAGAVNVGLGGSFATWCGTLLARDRPIVIVAAPGRELEAATRLGRIGFDNVAEAPGRRHAGARRPARAGGADRAGDRGLPGRAARRLAGAVGDRRARAGGVGGAPDRGVGQRAAVAAGRAPGRASGRPPAGRPVRQRLPVGDRRRGARPGRIRARARPRRRSGSVGIRAARAGERVGAAGGAPPGR